MKIHRNEFIVLGIRPEYFGTYSVQKGTTVFVATGCTVSQTMTSVCLRANWILWVKFWYIKYGGASDQFVGMSISGRSILKK